MKLIILNDKTSDLAASIDQHAIALVFQKWILIILFVSTTIREGLLDLWHLNFIED